MIMIVRILEAFNLRTLLLYSQGYSAIERVVTASIPIVCMQQAVVCLGKAGLVQVSVVNILHT